MKTRILYPNFWTDDRIGDLSKDAKVLLFNLLTSRSLGLTKYLKVGDRIITAETGLSKSEIEKGRLELPTIGIYYFSGWYYLDCDFISYVDYQGQERVMQAKEKELKAIPTDILTGFKEVINPLTTGQRPNLNPKLETLNPKLGGLGEEDYQLIKDTWKTIVGTSLRNHEKDNTLAYHYLIRESDYSLEELLQAVRMIRVDKYQKRTLQAKMNNFIGVREKLDDVEAFISSHLDKMKIEQQSNEIIL